MMSMHTSRSAGCAFRRATCGSGAATACQCRSKQGCCAAALFRMRGWKYPPASRLLALDLSPQGACCAVLLSCRHCAAALVPNQLLLPLLLLPPLPTNPQPHNTPTIQRALSPTSSCSPQHLHASDGSHSPRMGSPRREASPSRRGSSPRTSPPASPRFSGGQAQGRQG